LILKQTLKWIIPLFKKCEEIFKNNFLSRG